MLRVFIDRKKLVEWKKIAKIGKGNFVFSGSHVGGLIEQVIALTKVVEKFLIFDRWVRSDFDRDSVYVEQYNKLLDDVREAVKRITIVKADVDPCRSSKVS